MSFLPVVDRELRVAARRRGTYWTRLLFAGICAGLVGLVLMFASVAQGGTSGIGAGLFYFLTLIVLGFSAFAGVFLTADCLSEEKRGGTLGLLFLTDLKGYDVVLGKLMAASVPAIYGVLAVFPVLAITLTMGGVTAGEFWRMTLVFMNTLFYSLSLGMLVSSVSQQENRATTGTAGLILLIGCGLPFVEFVLTHLGAPVRFTMALPSPLTAWHLAFDASNRLWSRSYWVSLLCMHGSSWLFLIAASLLLPRLWRPREGKSPRTTPLSPEAAVRLIGSAANRKALMEVNPVYWLNSRRNSWPWITWATALFAWVAALTGIGLAWGINAPAAPLVFLSVPFASLLLMAPARIEMGIQASRFFSEPRRTGALELLLSTPLTTEEIIQGHWLTLRRRFLAPVASLVGLVLLMLVFGLVGAGRDFILFAIFMGGKCLFLVAAFIADVLAAGWVGMLMGLTAKKPGQAPGLTVLYTVVLPTVAFCVPDLVVAVPLIFWARDKLRRELRALSIPRYSPVTPLDARGDPISKPPLLLKT
jgi:ABC-type transport system involved in multi-copper enzyme maturation permease subunit